MDDTELRKLAEEKTLAYNEFLRARSAMINFWQSRKKLEHYSAPVNGELYIPPEDVSFRVPAVCMKELLDLIWFHLENNYISAGLSAHRDFASIPTDRIALCEKGVH